jgi:hypothetical protein
MGKNLPPQTIYQFIVNDFKDAWNSLAWNPSARGRGNFMFAQQAMILLEFAARLCFTDASGEALSDLSKALFKIEPRYSTRLPSVCADFREFDLPYNESKGDELLWAIFDLVRNGQAHQYQQILVNLEDGVDFQVSLTGADMGRHLELVSKSTRPPDHLGYRRDQQNDVWLIVCPDILFLDVDKAITTSKLLEKGLAFTYLRRPKLKGTQRKKKLAGPFYQFDSIALERSLALGGHKKI